MGVLGVLRSQLRGVIKGLWGNAGLRGVRSSTCQPEIAVAQRTSKPYST